MSFGRQESNNCLPVEGIGLSTYQLYEDGGKIGREETVASPFPSSCAHVA